MGLNTEVDRKKYKNYKDYLSMNASHPSLNERQKIILTMRQEGYSLKEVGGRFGYSRQYAEQELKRISIKLNKYDIPDEEIKDLKILRKSKGIRLEDVAKNLKISNTTYRMKEAGENEFKASEIIKLAETLEKPLERIFDLITKKE